MSTSIFALDVKKKMLTRLPRRSMKQLNLSEPYDLEAWLASTSDGLFDRKIVWVARQDRPSEEQRSDLVGIDHLGNLLITELKRGTVGEDAVTQALAYAAEYADMTADDIAELFALQSEKATATGLVSKAKSLEDAQASLSNHVEEEAEVNESQILLLVGEDFTAKTLAICDYINRSSGEASFSIECWKYGVFETGGAHYFMIEQILPPPTVRQAIDEKREASKDRKYARDPVRVDFMRSFMRYLLGKPFKASRSRGQSYECRISSSIWISEPELRFSLRSIPPSLILPKDLIFSEDAAKYNVTVTGSADGRKVLTFTEISAENASFSAAFGDRVVQILQMLKEVPQTGETNLGSKVVVA